MKRDWLIELPTLFLALFIYTSWGLLTWHFHFFPVWLSFPLAAFLTAWHSSLQHETLHGHPSRLQWFNDLLGYLPLGLIYPYPIYKESHLAHHDTEHLTHPIEDPESYYVTIREWNRIRPVSRFLLRIHNTLLGRLLLGPAIAMIRLFRMECLMMKKGDFRHTKAWGVHLLLSTAVMYWVMSICEISFLRYFFFFVYPGMSLILLRSFAEHRPNTSGNTRRSALVESEIPFRILYLGNNYHYLHHKTPGMPWYQLHTLYQKERDDLMSENGAYFFKGYSEIFRKYAFKPKEEPIHPYHAEDSTNVM